MAAEFEKIAGKFKKNGFNNIAKHAELLAEMAREQGAPETFREDQSYEERKISDYDQALVKVLGPELTDSDFGRQVREIGRRIAPHFED